MNRLNRYSTNFYKLVMAVFSAIGIISFATIITLNSTWIYPIMVDKYNLVAKTAVNKGELIVDYKKLVSYLQNPFINKLQFNKFKMSEFGEIHFYEVKKIFLILIVIAVVTIFIWVILWTNKRQIDYRKKLFNIMNSVSNTIFIFFILMMVLYFTDFSWAFTMFHKIFFRNDYWIFDPVTDPIIKALPEELFMIFGVVIIILSLLMAIAMKIIYFKNKNQRAIAK